MTLMVFARQSKAGVRTLGYSGERLLNLFLRMSDGVAEAPLIGASGAVEYVDLGDTVRAMINNSGSVYAVAGTAVYKVDGGVAVNVGLVAATGDVYMANSGTEVAIVTGGKYYICDGTTTTEYNPLALSSSTGVTYQDGYFIVTGTIGDRGDAFTVSALDDGTTFDALDFSFAENTPDEIRATISDHGELWMFGAETVEVFYNGGGADFPFTRNAGALKEQGCLNGKTVAKLDNSVFWVRPDGAVVRSVGTSPQVISTQEVKEVINDATVTGGFTFSDKGHEFYCVNLSGQPSWLYDLTTGLWHERSSGVGENEWRCTSQTISNGVEYFGTSTGKIMTLDPDVYTDDGDVLTALAVSVPIEQGGEYIPINKIHMNVRSGAVDIGRTPRIMLQSTKNGRDWSNEKWRDMGTLGEYYRRTTWNGLGAFRRAQFRVMITDAVPRDIYGVHYG